MMPDAGEVYARLVTTEPSHGVVRPLDMDIETDLPPLERLRPSDDFEEFYRRSWQSVYRPLVATIGDQELAAEAVDEAMARAYARWRSVHKMSNGEGWVYRVAYRWSVDRLRRRDRERRLLPRLVGTPVSEPSMVEPGLAPALDVLPMEQRAVVVLACAFDWSEKEIAEALRIRQGTVKSRLHRGLQRLREEMHT